VPAASVGEEAEGRVVTGGWTPIVVVAVAAGALSCVGLAAPGLYDNEGRFAEAAREMSLRGDWVTPYLNGYPILTKPPLTQWLAAVVFALVGTTEWVRLVAVVASVLTLVATGRLGSRLYGLPAGMMATVALATMVGFVLEARTLRPDALLVAASTWTILCWTEAETCGGRTRTAWLTGFYAALGVGILAKGMVPLVVVGPPLAFVMLRRHGLAAVRRMRPGLGLLVLAAVVGPWHVAAASANPGFAWDYVVHQHLLFAFDRKVPRDSVGDSLGFFGLALLARSAPWGLLAAATLPEAWRELRAGREAWRTIMPWVWALGHVGVFGLTPSRLEHYTLPAQPALALLAGHAAAGLVAGRFVGRFAERSSRESVRGPALMLAVLGLAAAVAGAVLVLAGPALVSRACWITQAPAVLALPRPAGVVMLAGGAGVLFWTRRRPALALASLTATAILMGALCVRALVLVTPLFSWRPVAASIRAAAAPDVEVVFEAGVEYQLVGGLNFYLGRNVTLLEPPEGFVPPGYLRERMHGLFIDREELGRRWEAKRPVLFVSDPERRRDVPDGIVAGPFEVLVRYGDRWVLANPAAAR
jgi:4-amino-4-deoxy-L-arabinose transferase-like glycosyltransferase